MANYIKINDVTYTFDENNNITITDPVNINNFGFLLYLNDQQIYAQNDISLIKFKNKTIPIMESLGGYGSSSSEGYKNYNYSYGWYYHGTTNEPTVQYLNCFDFDIGQNVINVKNTETEEQFTITVNSSSTISLQSAEFEAETGYSITNQFDSSIKQPFSKIITRSSILSTDGSKMFEYISTLESDYQCINSNSIKYGEVVYAKCDQDGSELLVGGSRHETGVVHFEPFYDSPYPDNFKLTFTKYYSIGKEISGGNKFVISKGKFVTTTSN